MPVPKDVNSQIALKKGWEWLEEKGAHFWRNPAGNIWPRPDFVGTLKGVSGMLQELQDREKETSHNWMIRWSTFLKVWDVWKEDDHTRERFAQFLSTKEEGFGVAVGRAYLSMEEVSDVTEQSD